MARVLLTGSRQGLQKIALTKLIQSRTGTSLAVAKGNTDSLLEGQTVVLELQTSDEAREFVTEARKLGALAELASGSGTGRAAPAGPIGPLPRASRS